MEKRIVKDIATIANLLDGKVDFDKIEWSQLLMGKHGESFNDLIFLKRMYGVYFYTSRACLDRLCHLNNRDIPIYVVCEESKNVYRIE